MARNPKYDVLFEPIKLGPVTAPNRFYQVPHCTGMGYDRPRTLAAMRAMKAEGGWGVVNTEYCSIHPTSDDTPFSFASAWDKDDIKNLALMADGVHEHGALAGLQMWHGGATISNLMSRLPTMDVNSQYSYTAPVQSKRMDKEDIRNLRRWHVDAALRAMEAQFDIVYVYPGHHYLLHHFLGRHTNDRTDEYGGSVANRVRIVREILEDVKDAVGHKMAVATRMSIDSGLQADGVREDDEAREMLDILKDLPDLWDLVIDDYGIEMGISRFAKEGDMANFVSYVKDVTDKPVVAVGRYTTPDTMARMINKGVVDMIGAARPSIADPFIPNKINEGTEDQIRECIGCNICYAHNSLSAPLRCTQNPTMGEEWRRGWHPEKVPAATTKEPVLIVGAGPAGLEAAHILGKRGYPVTLAEAGTELGGRVTREATLPGNSEVARVRDYRVQALQQMPNVEIYMDSKLGAAEVLEFGFPRVIIATGATWRRNGIGRYQPIASDKFSSENMFTPDDIMAGVGVPDGPVVVFDDEHYYMGALIAEKMAKEGHTVTYVTSGSKVGQWGSNTSEQDQTQAHLINLGVTIIVSKWASAWDSKALMLDCIYTGQQKALEASSYIAVGSREPNEGLFCELKDNPDALAKAGITQLHRIGDCEAPSIIAAAVYAGHKIGRTIDAPETDDVPYKRDRAVYGAVAG